MCRNCRNLYNEYKRSSKDKTLTNHDLCVLAAIMAYFLCEKCIDEVIELMENA